MPKRKGDVFTVIESINNWFEANEQYTHSHSEHEGVPGGSEPNSNALTELIVNGWAAKCPEPSNDERFATTISHVAPNRSDSSDGVGCISELAEEEATCSTSDPKLVVCTGKAVKSKGAPEANDNEGDPAGGYGPGISGLVPSLIPSPATGVTGDEGLTCTAFWQLLQDADYDVWGL